MSLKDTVKHMRDLLCNITVDLEKADGGNKAASQRVRTGTVRLEKIAKAYRKESIATEKKTKGQKRPSRAAARPKAAAKSKTAVRSSSAKIKTKPKAKSAKASVRAYQLSVRRRATAKIPARRRAF